MNQKVLSYLIGIGLLLVVLVSMVGCGLGEVERAAASNIPTSAENSDAGIDPADRKFFDGGYLANYAGSRLLTQLSSIDPADLKFFTAPYLAGNVVSMATIDPADLKFFNGGYMANYAESGSLAHLSNIDPADRKFFSGGYVNAGSVAKLAADGNLANRNTSSGN